MRNVRPKNDPMRVSAMMSHDAPDASLPYPPPDDRGYAPMRSSGNYPFSAPGEWWREAQEGGAPPGSSRRSPEYDAPYRGYERGQEERRYASPPGRPTDAPELQAPPSGADPAYGPRLPSPDSRVPHGMHAPRHASFPGREEHESLRTMPHHHHVVPHHHHVVPHHHHHHHHGAPANAEPSAPNGVPWQEETPAPVSDLRSALPGRPSSENTPGVSPLEAKLRELASGPRVDSEPVWEYLDRCEQLEEYERKNARASDDDAAPQPPAPATPPPDPRLVAGFGIGEDRGRAVRHLGSLVYDASGNECFPAELLVGNIGATLEVRISGRSIGPGITQDVWQADEAKHQAAVEARIRETVDDTSAPTLASLPPEAQEPLAALGGQLPGRWRLGWRGLEHARMNRDIRMANQWTENQLQQRTNKRMKRGSAGARAHPLPRATLAPTAAVDAESGAWAFWSQPSLVRRKLWGTDVYTDDSDVLAMCVHAGWIEAPHIPDVPEWLGGGGAPTVSQAWAKLAARQERALGTPHRVPPPEKGGALTCDLSVTLRIAPKLILYKGSPRGGIQSRSWGNTHDGVSVVVESVELRPVRR